MAAVYRYKYQVEPRLFRRVVYFNSFRRQTLKMLASYVLWLIGLAMLIADLFCDVNMNSVLQLAYVVILASLPLRAIDCERESHIFIDTGLASRDHQIELRSKHIKIKVVGDTDDDTPDVQTKTQTYSLDQTIPWDNVRGAYELKDAFVLFHGKKDAMVVLPKYAIPQDELEGVRHVFESGAGGNFHRIGREHKA